MDKAITELSLQPLKQRSHWCVLTQQWECCFTVSQQKFISVLYSTSGRIHQVSMTQLQLSEASSPLSTVSKQRSGDLCEAWWLEIAPVLLLVLDRAGPELDRIGAGPIFGPAPIRYLHFCVAHALKPNNIETVKP